MCEGEFKPNRSTRRRGNVRESSTGAKAGTFPKDGENIRSSELSEDLAQETRRKEGSGRLKTVAVAHGGVRCSEDQGAVDHGEGGKPEDRQERREGGVPGRPEPRTYARSQQLLAACPRGHAFSTLSPSWLLTARVFTVEWKQQQKRYNCWCPPAHLSTSHHESAQVPRVGRQATTT